MQDPKQYLAQAQQLAASGLGYETSERPRTLESAALIGAGTMGTGIAMAFASAGLHATLIDNTKASLERAMANIRTLWERGVAKGQLTQEQAQQRLALISTSTEPSTLASADVIVEAVWEQMELKQTVFRQIDKYAKPGALLGTNTSTLDIDQIAVVTSRPEDVIGLHFFSPAHVMRLLEIVRGKKTSSAAVRDAIALGTRIGKIPVAVGVCDGFVGNRIFGARESEATRLLLEGASPAQVDRVLVEFGFPMGSFVLQDMSGGIELIWRMNQAKGKPDALIDKLATRGRFGQKTRKGFYAYGEDGRTPLPDPEVDALIAEAAHEAGIERRAIDDTEILQRLIYPMLNEAAKILEERIADRASDIDVIWSAGYGWPRAKGGPMYYADCLGPVVVRDTLRALARRHGARFAPARLLEQLAEANGHFTSAALQ
jgi:3-hydroxyacyl-CoA dehydrogenase